LVLRLRLPEPRDALVAYLLRRSGRCAGVGQQIQREVAGLIADERALAAADAPRVGLAEHLDLLRALGRLAPADEARQRALLQELKELALGKRRGLGA
jgi:hypothetical protein